MMSRYDEDDEFMEFVGKEKTQVRGTLEADLNGREWISTGGKAIHLHDILPNESQEYPEDADEYRFEIKVEVDKPSGEFRNDEHCGVIEIPEWSHYTPTNESDGRPDAQIVPYIDSLRSQGVETYQSCAGHETSDGHLWFDCSDFDVEHIANHERFGFVRRMYSAEECWAVMFRGMSKGEEWFEKDMEVLFDAIGAELP